MIFPGDGEKKMYAQEEKVVWCVQERYTTRIRSGGGGDDDIPW